MKVNQTLLLTALLGTVVAGIDNAMGQERRLGNQGIETPHKERTRRLGGYETKHKDEHGYDKKEYKDGYGYDKKQASDYGYDNKHKSDYGYDKKHKSDYGYDKKHKSDYGYDKKQNSDYGYDKKSYGGQSDKGGSAGDYGYGSESTYQSYGYNGSAGAYGYGSENEEKNYTGYGHNKYGTIDEYGRLCFGGYWVYDASQ